MPIYYECFDVYYETTTTFPINIKFKPYHFFMLKHSFTLSILDVLC